MNYIERETTILTNSQHTVAEFLRQKNIPLGLNSKHGGVALSVRKKLLVAVSSLQNPIDCRVTLGKAPIGAKCVAPCGCSGSQKWIQFLVLNKLRRRDPDQWKVCRTCQQPFDYSVVQKYGSVGGNILTLLLDNVALLRILSFTLISALLFATDSYTWLLRLITSQSFWRLYPKWSRVVHFPFVFQLWGGKIALQYLAQAYTACERRALSWLADWESRLVEARLPASDAAE